LSGVAASKEKFVGAAMIAGGRRMMVEVALLKVQTHHCMKNQRGGDLCRGWRVAERRGTILSAGRECIHNKDETSWMVSVVSEIRRRWRRLNEREEKTRFS
jgi:hypothetical protein